MRWVQKGYFRRLWLLMLCTFAFGARSDFNDLRGTASDSGIATFIQLFSSEIARECGFDTESRTLVITDASLLAALLEEDNAEPVNQYLLTHPEYLIKDYLVISQRARLCGLNNWLPACISDIVSGLLDNNPDLKGSASGSGSSSGGGEHQTSYDSNGDSCPFPHRLKEIYAGLLSANCTISELPDHHSAEGSGSGSDSLKPLDALIVFPVNVTVCELREMLEESDEEDIKGYCATGKEGKTTIRFNNPGYQSAMIVINDVSINHLKLIREPQFNNDRGLLLLKGYCPHIPAGCTPTKLELKDVILEDLSGRSKFLVSVNTRGSILFENGLVNFNQSASYYGLYLYFADDVIIDKVSFDLVDGFEFSFAIYWLGVWAWDSPVGRLQNLHLLAKLRSGMIGIAFYSMDYKAHNGPFVQVSNITFEGGFAKGFDFFHAYLSQNNNTNIVWNSTAPDGVRCHYYGLGLCEGNIVFTDNSTCNPFDSAAITGPELGCHPPEVIQAFRSRSQSPGMSMSSSTSHYSSITDTTKATTVVSFTSSTHTPAASRTSFISPTISPTVSPSKPAVTDSGVIYQSSIVAIWASLLVAMALGL